MFKALFTSLIQLKLDQETAITWREASKAQLVEEIPHHGVLLTFLDQRASSIENSVVPTRQAAPTGITKSSHVRNIPSHISSAISSGNNCHLCPNEKHPLYACGKFKAMTIDERKSTLTIIKACYKCLRVGHQSSQCQFSNTCKRCQRLHHTFMHLDQQIAPHYNNVPTPCLYPRKCPMERYI